MLGKRAEDAQHFRFALALGVDGGPIRVMRHGRLIPQHAVVNQQRDAFLAGDLAPHGQRILHDPRRGPADLRRIPGIARHAHAVVLHEVGPDAAQERADVLLRHVPAQCRVGLVRVQVEVNAEVTVLALDGGLAGGGPGQFGSQRGRLDTRTATKKMWAARFMAGWLLQKRSFVFAPSVSSRRRDGKPAHVGRQRTMRRFGEDIPTVALERLNAEAGHVHRFLRLLQADPVDRAQRFPRGRPDHEVQSLRADELRRLECRDRFAIRVEAARVTRVELSEFFAVLAADATSRVSLRPSAAESVRDIARTGSTRTHPPELARRRERPRRHRACLSPPERQSQTTSP